MRQLLLLLFVAALCAGSFLEDGKEYTYDMEIYQNSGTMDHAPAAAGLAYRLKLQMQVSGNTLNVKSKQLTYSQYAGDWDSEDWAWDKTNFLPADISAAEFSIKYKNGLVESVSVPSSASIHEKNAIKAFASVWQIKTGETAFFQSEEKLVHGNCRVQYTVSPGVVTKGVSHLKDCSNRVYRHVDNFRGYRCDGQYAEEAFGSGSSRREGRTSPEPIYSNSNAMFFVEEKGNKFQVNKMVSSGAVVAQYFETEGVSHFIHVNRSLTLVEVKSSDGSLRGPSSPEQVTDLSYEWETKTSWDDGRDLKAREPYFSSGEYFKEGQSELQAALVGILDNLIDAMELHDHDQETISKLHKFGAGSAMPVLYALDFNSLSSVFDQLKADTSERGVMKQNLFREFATETGTAASAMWIKDAVSKNLFESERDSARAVTGVAFHVRRPNKELVEEFAQLVEAYKDSWGEMVGPLAIAHLVRRTCELAGSMMSSDRQRCTVQLVEPWAEKFYAEMSKPSTSDERKHILIGAMFNLGGPKVTELLKPMAQGEMREAGVDDNLQKKAMLAAVLGTYYTRTTKDFYLPIFLNMRNGHESRIYAIDFLMSMDDIDVTTLATIMSQMYAEPDFEVKNYVFSLFEKHAHGQNLCFKERKTERVKYFLKYMKQAGLHDTNYGVGVSKTYRQSYHQEQYGYSGGYEYWVIGSHNSAAPLELGMQIDTNLYNGYRDNMMMVVIRIQGLAKGLVAKFHKMGREWKIEDLQAVLANMGVVIKPDIPIRVELRMFLKNIMVAQSTYTAADAEEGGKLRQFLKDLQGKSANSYKINHQRGLAFGSSLYEQPTDSGLPMSHVSAVTSLVSLEATVKRGLRRGVIFRDLDYNAHLMTQGSNMILFQQPTVKRTFGIVQDRVFTTHLPRQIVVGVNLVKKELKIQLNEPEVSTPILLLMHSKTVVTVRQDTLSGDIDLTSTCPSCTSNKHIVSAGPSALKSRTMMDTTTINFGSTLKSEYFDCELDMSGRNSISSTAAAFMPYNKYPKTPWSLFMLGIRQVRSFFTYFPRAEQCGIYFSYSQSPEHPVKEVEISIQGKRVANKKSSKLGTTGYSTFLKMKVAAKGPAGAGEDREFKLNIKHDSSVLSRKNSVKAQLATLANPNVGIEAYMVCFSMENEYSNADRFEKELMYLDLGSTLEVWGKADIKYGVGTTCGAAVGSTDVTFRHSTTQEGREELKEKDYYKKCMEQAASPEWNTRVAGGIPYTSECWQAAGDAGLARKYTWNMNFEKTTPRVRGWLDNAHTVLKAAVLPYWNADPAALRDPISDANPKIDFIFKFNNKDRSVDSTFVTAKGTSRFPDIAFNTMPSWTNSLRQLRMDTTFSSLIMERVISACVQTSAQVFTMDRTVVKTTPTSCWSLVSAHCSPNPTYAVFTKQNGNMPLAMKVHIGGHIVEFTPSSSSSVDVTFNGRPMSVEDQGASVGKEGKTKLFSLVKWGPVYTLFSDYNVVVLYDGTFVEVIPAPWVKGQHCGVCGNFDGNTKNEMQDKTGAMVPADMLSRAWCQQ